MIASPFDPGTTVSTAIELKTALAEKQKKLKELRAKIKAERRYVNIKEFSHNIVSLLLRQIADDFGKDEANKAITDLGLDCLGWRVEA